MVRHHHEGKSVGVTGNRVSVETLRGYGGSGVLNENARPRLRDRSDKVNVVRQGYSAGAEAFALRWSAFLHGMDCSEAYRNRAINCAPTAAGVGTRFTGRFIPAKFSKYFLKFLPALPLEPLTVCIVTVKLVSRNDVGVWPRQKSVKF